MEKLMRVEQFADLLDVSKSTAYDLIARRKLPYIKLSGNPWDRSGVRLREEDVAEFIAIRTIEAQ